MSTTSTSSSEILTNLSTLLPTGTFLTFQTLAPLFTNNGVCGTIEKTMTGLLVLTFSIICYVLSFTDSITSQSGHVYYGIVTTKGLYNPQFTTANMPYTQGAFYTGPTGTTQFFLKGSDFVNAFLTVICFCTLSLLTSPVTDCFYSKIPNTVSKSVPILVALLVGLYFAFAPPARHGVGFAIANVQPHVLTMDGVDAAPSASTEMKLTKSTSRALLLKDDAIGTRGKETA
ncbi:hypothetical protein O6H91_12G099900 [Diphasiastrum complanatum]|uniref:Uncharacterized protein n=1 Tax=Diphasiastrum complanatum TaxID=34168 RepID=A0ACC2C532_DIPCM|nr:hypothetical protein O6H91_Y427700 [Diphasiastrum complanatum]KAJ7537146.1 hypothetical protein O6H91_12G099900 [Diphasiastrum complanatum]